MLKMKKVLIAATVMTALCATAFAANDEMHKPSMHDRVNAIMHEDQANCPMPPKDGEHDRFRNDHRRPPMSDEQKAEMQKRHAEWEKMTPEQRQKAHEKMMKERQEQHDKHAKETMAKLTPEQKAEVEAFIKEGMEQRQAHHDKFQAMTEDQREAVRANRPMHQGPKDGMHRPGPKGDHRPEHRGDFKGHGPKHAPEGEHNGPRPQFNSIAD